MDLMMALKRHEILGKNLFETPEVTLDLVLVQGEERYVRRTAPGQIQQEFDRALNVGDIVFCAVLNHLGYGPIERIEFYLHRGVDRSIEYFFGDWWTHDAADARALDKSRPDRNLRWFGVLPNAMLLGGLTGRWDDVAKICSWFDATIQAEYQAGQIEDEYMQLFLCIASDLSPEPMPGIDEVLTKVKACRRRRPKLLCAAWEAAVARDQKAFDKALKASVSHFLKVDAQNVPNVSFWVALHQSIVWLIAERNGLTFPELPEQVDAAVVRRQTIGLA